MLEFLVIALLIWLWVIERRLHALRDSVHALKLDVDGLRSMRTHAKAEVANPPPAPPGLPEVSTLNGAERQAAAS